MLKVPKRRRKRRGNYERCGYVCKVGTIRTRKRNRRGLEVRYIKVADRGSRQWILLARYTWECMHGPVPRGKRVVHRDGNTLNDDPANYCLMTPGEVIKHYHELRPEMSEENRRGKKRREAIAEHNRERGRVRRTLGFLTWRWYAIDRQTRIVYETFHRSRTAVLVEIGVLESHRKNGAISRKRLEALPCELLRGGDMDHDEFRHYERRSLQQLKEAISGKG